MAKFHGVIGFGRNVETKPGVWEDVIEERKYFGDVLRLSRDQQESSNTVNDNISIGHSIEVMADATALERYRDIRYIQWEGNRWKITSVEIRRPRLVFRLGDLYNGPTA